MILDAGMLKIYAVSSTEGTAPPPVRRNFTEKLCVQYGERIVGCTRYYAAAKIGQQIDRVVRIWQNKSITVRDVCMAENGFYRIRKVTHLADEDGLLVTDLDLENDDDILRGWWNESQNR